MVNLSYFFPILFSNSSLAYNVCKNVILRQLFCTHTKQNFHYTLEFIIHSFFLVSFLNHAYINGQLIKTLKCICENHYYLQLISRSFNAKKISKFWIVNRSSTMLASFLQRAKERWSHCTATMAAILDFSQTGKTGHEQSYFGQQPCHCRLAGKPFHFRF